MEKKDLYAKMNMNKQTGNKIADKKKIARYDQKFINL